MSSLEQRVAYMEGRMEDHAALFADIRAEMRGLRAEMTGEFRALRTEMDRRFTWTIGLLVTVLVTVLTGMAGLAYQIARLHPH
jgi:hypothetical protein